VNRSSLALSAVVAVGAALLLGACSPSARPAQAASATPPPLPADVQSVATVGVPANGSPGGPADAPSAAPETRLQLTGEFASRVRSDLVARTPGRVGRVFVDEGSPVQKGQPLLELETEYLKLEVERAEADVARAEAAARDAQRDFERKAGLLPKGSVSQAVHDRSQAGAEEADAARASAKAALGLARQRLADSVLVSPIDGVVAERRTDVGERLSEGTVAFIVQQTAPLRLRFRVPERYLASVRVGQTVNAFVDPYPGEAFAGRISLVGGSVDTATRTFLVEAEFSNRDRRLRPGLFARVEADLGTIAGPAASPSPAGS
jgi:membrane fusion protein, multidrug efflux system